MKQRILFLVNPVSGGISKKNFPAEVEASLDHNIFDDEIRYWTDDKDAAEMTRQAVSEGFNVIVAVGGDGTVNRIASVLKNTEVLMGIIPMGSGNGLARHLGIPLKTRPALELINRFVAHRIDTLSLNGNTFVNMAGTGFDAHIGHLFATAGTRGFYTYFKITLKELFSYRPQRYELEYNGTKEEEDAFLVSFANGSQWGNNAYIAPLALTADGYIEVSLLRPFRWYQAIPLAWKLFTKRIHRSPLVKHFKTREITVNRSGPGAVHLDGEPVMAEASFHLSVEPSSLLLIC